MSKNDQWKIKASVANRVYVAATKSGVRFTFGESPDGTDKNEQLHTSIFIPHEVAISLTEMLNNSYKDALDKLNINTTKK